MSEEPQQQQDEVGITDNLIPDLRDEHGRPKLTTQDGDLKGPNADYYGEDHASAEPVVGADASGPPGQVGVPPGETRVDDEGNEIKGPNPEQYPAPVTERFRQAEEEA